MLVFPASAQFHLGIVNMKKRKTNNDSAVITQKHAEEISQLSRKALDLLRDLEWLENDPACPKALYQKRAEYARISDQISQLMKASHQPTENPLIRMSLRLANKRSSSSEIISVALTPPSISLKNGTKVDLTDFLASKNIDQAGLAIKISATNITFSNARVEDQKFCVEEILNFHAKDNRCTPASRTSI